VVHPRPDQPVVQGGGQAAQIGILRQGLNDGLGFPQLLGDADDLLDRREQQAVLLEERASSCLHERVEQILLAGQFRNEGRGGLRRELGGRGVDDRQHRLLFWRKELLERHLPLPPRQIEGNQLVDVGIDGEMAGGVNAADHSQK
jgi:hypothetical protein